MAIVDRTHASVITHPLAREELTTLRHTETTHPEFRGALQRLGRVCGAELVADRFETESVHIRTPLAETSGERVAGRTDVVLVTVLRAAIPFVEGLVDIFPEARQGVISASRQESGGRTADGGFEVATEYVNLPDIGPEDRVIVADPMLATGSTLVAVLDAVDGGVSSPRDLVTLSAVSAPEGLGRVVDAHEGVDCVTVAIDDHLDEDGYIVPGLGDAGDRAFGTA